MSYFNCLRCTNCCRNFIVPITRLDLAKWLNLGLDFLVASVVEIGGFEALKYGSTSIYALPRKTDGDCLYLYDFKCLIYEVRPMVCILFPFAYNSRLDKLSLHPWAINNCEAVSRGFMRLKLEEEAELLQIARIVYNELRKVDPFKKDYVRMIARALKKVKEASCTLKPLSKPIERSSTA